jgi:hypothetical protein
MVTQIAYIARLRPREFWKAQNAFVKGVIMMMEKIFFATVKSIKLIFYPKYVIIRAWNVG